MPICEGTSITINAGNGFDSYTWSTNANTQSIIVSQAGSYAVTVTENYNGINCSSTKNFTVVNSNVATVSEIITSDWTDNNNTISVLLTNSSVGNYVYSLDGINYQNSNVFYGLESGEYTVFVKDTNGCGISSEEVYLLMYPKFFTPNGDSYNDTWKIKFSQKERNLKIAIFDRYGKLLKTMNSSESWDGKLNGKDLPSDDYWFVVTRQNGKEFRGHFAMKR
jgi:gliding motility-associated-like protein